jgi:predicted  nucleic acid-binding Zn-ribbon protein
LSSHDLARQIADIDAQIADAEARIFQHQKRVENTLARGGDASELRTTIAALTKALADLEAQKGELVTKMGRSTRSPPFPSA